jgi:hypothetical protein
MVMTGADSRVVEPLLLYETKDPGHHQEPLLYLEDNKAPSNNNQHAGSRDRERLTAWTTRRCIFTFASTNARSVMFGSMASVFIFFAIVALIVGKEKSQQELDADMCKICSFFVNIPCGCEFHKNKNVDHSPLRRYLSDQPQFLGDFMESRRPNRATPHTGNVRRPRNHEDNDSETSD